MQNFSQCLLEMLKFPQNPGNAWNRHRTSFAQSHHSSLGHASSLAVYPFIIRALMLSTARARRAPRVRPAKARRGPSARPRALPVGSNLTSLMSIYLPGSCCSWCTCLLHVTSVCALRLQKPEENDNAVSDLQFHCHWGFKEIKVDERFNT